MPTLRSAARIAWVGVCLAVGCGGHDDAMRPSTPSDQGVSAEFIVPAMDVVSFTRFVVTTIAFDWNAQGHLDASWAYDAGLTQWARRDSGYSNVYVASPGGPTTEVRYESVVDMHVQFLKSGVPQADLMTADQARLQLRVRHLTSTWGGPYVPEKTYDITTRTSTQFGIDAGSADTILVLGNVQGWWEHAVSLGRQRFDYGGTVGIELDYPEHFITCPAERMTADIYVFEDGAEVDRYVGSFSAHQDQEVFSGAMESERGPGRYAINGNRGCPTQAGASAARTRRAKATKHAR